MTNPFNLRFIDNFTALHWAGGIDEPEQKWRCERDVFPNPNAMLGGESIS